MKRLLILLLAVALCSVHDAAAQRTFDLTDYGLRPGGKEAAKRMERALERIRSKQRPGEKIVIRLAQGRYDFHPAEVPARDYYISNHDQALPKRAGIVLEGWQDMTIDGQGAELMFHGQMLPIALVGSRNCAIKNLSIDFENPHIAQVTVVKNDPERGIEFRPEAWVRYRLTADSLLETYGDGWTLRPYYGMAFDSLTRRIVYNTGDILTPMEGVREVGDGLLLAPRWRDKRLQPGMKIVLRTGDRPTPGIFLDDNRDTYINNVTVHYAQGMGLLAQNCENIELDGMNVCLRGEKDPRCFTTQADATHFSGCHGRITSRNNLYEGMMDDAINVHGTYLKIVERVDDHTVIGRYMHDQSWGFRWGEAGDSVQFIRSASMQTLPARNRIAAIAPADTETVAGAHLFRIRFAEPLDEAVDAKTGFGIENLSRTPEVLFENNIIRNNRARGALFSTPRRTVVRGNLFDHTSGSAILLCGDCNGWFETGACHDVLIEKNRFVNALTSRYQFTEGIIAICPVIPRPVSGHYFHSGITIRRNRFETFRVPIVFALSVDGLRFEENTIVGNDDFPQLLPTGGWFCLDRVTDVKIEEP